MNGPPSLAIRPFFADDTEAVVALWTVCGLTRPWNDPRRDIARKATVQPELFLVGTVDDAVVATAMVGFDGHRGWFKFLAVSDAMRRRGVGRALMAEAERLLFERGCPKLNLQLRRTNDAAAGFYRALGYREDDAVCLGKRLIVDGPGSSADETPRPDLSIDEETTMTHPRHAIHWFEIPVDDFDRARMFYERIFDYEMTLADLNGRRLGMLPFDPDERAIVGGAIVKADDFLPARHGTLVYLDGGDDLSIVLTRVEPAGGKVLTDKTLITPEIGWFGTFLDTEGNKVALHSAA